MSKYIYPGSNEVDGPWLLDKDSLQKFENMINEITGELSVDAEEDYKIRYELSFTDGKSIIESSLSDIDINNDIKQLCPQRLTVNIYSDTHPIYCTELIFDFKKSFPTFKYDIRNTNSEETKLRVTNKIEDWIENNKPSKFLSVWSHLSFYFPLYGALILMLILLAFSSRNSSLSAYQRSLSSQVEAVLENGINENNYMKALELLLAKEYDYVPSTFQNEIDPFGYIISIFITILVCTIGYFSPKSNIAIGAGRNKVKFWKSYVKIITYTIPTLILLPLLVNFITSIFS